MSSVRDNTALRRFELDTHGGVAFATYRRAGGVITFMHTETPRAFGLHDTAGNVFEWVQDCWHDSYDGAPPDGSAWVSGGDCKVRVQRGGAWGYPPAYLRAAVRGRQPPDYRYVNAGLRLARTLAPCWGEGRRDGRRGFRRRSRQLSGSCTIQLDWAYLA